MANKYFRKNLNKGGGADTGKIGEIKSKLATIGNPFKRIKTPKPKLKAPKRKPMKPLKKIKVFDKETNKNIFINRNELMKNLDRYNPSTGTERLSEGDIKRAKKLINMKKGGRAKMMGGGMMGRRFGMKEGTPPKRTRPGQNPKGKNVPILERAPKELPTKRKKMMGGGSLKAVDPKTQKGLSKLPTEVRNKMGYMKKGGRA
jgi:hypothetical protein